MAAVGLAKGRSWVAFGWTRGVPGEGEGRDPAGTPSSSVKAVREPRAVSSGGRAWCEGPGGLGAEEKHCVTQSCEDFSCLLGGFLLVGRYRAVKWCPAAQACQAPSHLGSGRGTGGVAHTKICNSITLLSEVERRKGHAVPRR